MFFAQLEEDEKKTKGHVSSKRIKVFGERAVKELIKEFSQIEHGIIPDKPVIEKEHVQVLKAVSLIKQKNMNITS